MTTTTPLPAGPRARFRDLLAAEWIKFWSLRSMWWVLGLSALVIVGGNLNAAKRTYDQIPPDNPLPASGDLQAALDSSFTMLAADILLLVAGGVGAVVIAGEYATGMIRTTLAAVPDRRALLAAKAGVLTAVMTGYGAVVAGTSFVLAQAVLSGRGAGVSITHPGALRFVAAAALFAPVCALTGLALGVLIRHGAATVVGTVVVLFLLPSVFTDTYRWSAAVKHAMPFPAWRRLSQVDLTNTLIPDHPATVAGSWTAFALWPLVAVLIATAVIHRRDV
ncbi:ABC transporter permease [Kitasatospora sp. NPDC004240]